MFVSVAGWEHRVSQLQQGWLTQPGWSSSMPGWHTKYVPRTGRSLDAHLQHPILCSRLGPGSYIGSSRGGCSCSSNSKAHQQAVLRTGLALRQGEAMLRLGAYIVL